MDNEEEEMIERRRMRRKMKRWRLDLIVIMEEMIEGLEFYQMRREKFKKKNIEKVRIEGKILEKEEILKRIEKIEGEEEVKGVIMMIDQKGGKKVGGEEI